MVAVAGTLCAYDMVGLACTPIVIRDTSCGGGAVVRERVRGGLMHHTVLRCRLRSFNAGTTYIYIYYIMYGCNRCNNLRGAVT